MKKHLSSMLLILVFSVGSGLILYPSLSDRWNSLHQSKAIASYIESVSDLKEERYETMMEEAKEYNKNLAQKGTCFLLTEEEKRVYDGILNFDISGIMGYIDIDIIRCRLPVYHGTDDSVLQSGVGHISGSSFPVGGEDTHCLLSGHRGLPSAKIFSDLDRLTPGDTFVLHTMNEILVYEVDKVSIVLPEDTSALSIEKGRDMCTLITCTPYAVNSHRLLVRGHRISYRGNTDLRVSPDAVAADPLPISALIYILLLIIGYIIFNIRAARRKKLNQIRKKIGLG